MYTTERIYLTYKVVLRFVCTSAVRKCEIPGEKKSKLANFLLRDSRNGEGQRRKKILDYPEVTVSQEVKQRAKNNLKELLENLKVETQSQKKNSENNDVNTPIEILNRKFLQKNLKAEKKGKNLRELAVKAVEDVAEEMGGDVKKTKQDLLSHLMSIEISTEPDNLKKGQEMSVDVTEDSYTAWISVLGKMSSSERLGIFKEKSDFQRESEVQLNLWEKLEQEELAYQSMKPVKNQFEEWVRWTEQGLLWQFPIDNDQGREAEAVDFTQHMFLEEHLEPWCPKKGPLKKFMELVLVGLSKNPFLTLTEKKEHIFWYRDYFESKKQLLQELGAFGSAKEIGKSESAQDS